MHLKYRSQEKKAVEQTDRKDTDIVAKLTQEQPLLTHIKISYMRKMNRL